MKGHYYVGVDIGQKHDPSALAIVEYVEVPGTRRDPETYALEVKKRLALRQVERMRLGIEFSDVAARVSQVVRYLNGAPPPATNAGWFQKPIDVTVVVDGTGVGRPVVEMIKKQRMKATVVPVNITGGMGANKGDGGFWNVSKQELMMNLAVLVDRGELRVAGNLRNKEEWIAEMASVDSRTLEGDPDDMVLATALACWRACRGKVGFSGEPLRFD